MIYVWLRRTANMKLNTKLKTQVLWLKRFGKLAQYDLIWKHDVTRFRMGGITFIGFLGLIERLDFPNFGHMTTSII